MSTQKLALELNIFCIAIIVYLLIRVIHRNDRQITQLKFRNMLIWHVIMLSANAFSPAIAAYIGDPAAKAAVSIVFYDLYYISLTLAVRSWFVYLAYSLPLDKKTMRRFMAWANISAGAIVALNATTELTHLVYYYDNGSFNKGPAAGIQIVFIFTAQLITAFAANIYAHKRMNTGGRKKIRLISTYPIIPFVFMILRQVLGNLPYLAVSNTMALLIIYIGYLDQLISRDPLTGLNNRNNLFDFISSRMTENRKLCVLMMDIDRFKHINDVYGHLEGDKALCIVADTLRQAIQYAGKSSFLARYGGDEFIISAESDEETVEKLMVYIHESLSHLTELKNTPYSLNISIGCAWFDSAAMRSPADLIEAADRALYKEKRKTYNR